MTRAIYTDNGAEKGFRARLYRRAEGGGVEWMFATDYEQGDHQWFFFTPRASLGDMLDVGYNLTLYNPSNRIAALITAATALRDQIEAWHNGGPPATPDESKALFEALDKALEELK